VQAVQRALPVAGLNLPAAHKTHTPALPVVPAAQRATHEPLMMLEPLGPGSQSSGGAQKQSAMLVDAFCAVVARAAHAEHWPALASDL